MVIFVALIATVLTVAMGWSTIHFWGETLTGMTGLLTILGTIGAVLNWKLVYDDYRDWRLKQRGRASLKRHIDHS